MALMTAMVEGHPAVIDLQREVAADPEAVQALAHMLCVVLGDDVAARQERLRVLAVAVVLGGRP